MPKAHQRLGWFVLSCAAWIALAQPVVAQPNLTPYRVPGWSDALVVTKTPGTSTDSTNLTPDDTLYVTWGMINNGNAATAVQLNVVLFVDGQLYGGWQVFPPMQPGSMALQSDYSIGKLAGGQHTFEIIVDAFDNIQETNELDNSYSKTISIAGPAPNLTPYQPPGWSDKIVVSKTTGTHTDDAAFTTADFLYVDWAVINSGAVGVSSSFNVTLYVDGAWNANWGVAGGTLDPGHYASAEDHWVGPLTAGTHTLTVVADPDHWIPESDESDNQYTKTITVLAKKRRGQITSN